MSDYQENVPEAGPISQAINLSVDSTKLRIHNTTTPYHGCPGTQRYHRQALGDAMPLTLLTSVRR
jgi:hypothetical protein